MSDRTAHADVSSSTCTASWGWMLFCQVSEELWKKVVMVSQWRRRMTTCSGRMKAETNLKKRAISNRLRRARHNKEVIFT